MTDELTKLDSTAVSRVKKMHAVHRFLFGAVPTSSWTLNPLYAEAIFLTGYGRQILEAVEMLEGSDIAGDFPGADGEAEGAQGAEPVPAGAAQLAALMQFYHNELIVDPDASDVDKCMEALEEDLIAGRYILPNHYGRGAYDRYNDIFPGERLQELDPEQFDLIFGSLGHGVYQIGAYVAGPLGIVESAEQRFTAPTRSVPLWHCSDTGCQYVHDVELIRRQNPVEKLSFWMMAGASASDGDPALWDGALDALHRREPYNEGQPFSNIVSILAESFSENELRVYLGLALSSSSGIRIRQVLEEKKGKAFVRCDGTTLASKFSKNECIQALLVLSNKALVGTLDIAIHDRRIKIPFTENRRGRAVSGLSPYDGSTEISALGTRSVHTNPMIVAASLIWTAYESSKSIQDLAWRCKTNAGSADIGMVLNFIRESGPRAAIHELVLPSRPIFESLQGVLWFDLRDTRDEEEGVDRILWKLGFDPLRHDRSLDDLRAHLSDFREVVLNSKTRMSPQERAAIRAAGVNVFVLLERVLEEIISFNVWVLSWDHFAATRFDYFPHLAVRRVSQVVSLSEQQTASGLSWNSEGGNTLGVLLAYARSAASWMKSLPDQARDAVERHERDLPHYKSEPFRRFPFEHEQLWADADLGHLRDFVAAFDGLVSQFEQSRLAEVRNGLDHYREEDQFPSQELLLACESRLSSALEVADIKRLYPNALWLVERKKSHFDDFEFVLSDYHGRKLVISRPGPLSGLPNISFNTSYVIPYGNLFGLPSSDLLLRVRNRSDYAQMWENYPRRQSVDAAIAAAEREGQPKESTLDGQ